MKLFLDKLLRNVPEINESRSYWFIRTDAGAYYNSFIADKVVCLGFENIPIEDISRLSRESEHTQLASLTDLVKRKHPSHGVPGLGASQLKRFFFEIKEGDYVIIPSVGTKHLAFGQVVDSKPFLHDFGEELKAKGFTWNKARRVRWDKVVQREFLSPNLFGMFSTHQAITSCNVYAEFLESAIYPIFKRNDKLYFQLEISGSRRISAQSLLKLYSTLMDGADELLDNAGIPENTTDIEIRVNLNSPGVISFIGDAGYAIVLISAIAVAIAGGKLSGKLKEFSINLETDGILKRMSEYKRDRHREKMTEDILKLNGGRNDLLDIEPDGND